jgi:hypothetical protein
MIMNDVIYNDIIVQWIPYLERPICSRKDFWLFSLKRSIKNKKYCSLLVDIHLHAGTPCNHRYCICKYFTYIDKHEYFKKYICVYNKL